MQQKYFVKYLSLGPVLLFVNLSFTAVILILVNYWFPDLLFHPLP
ncbi:MAG: Photosystem I reaction center subunit IX [Nostoc sp. C3-bin3]|nr:Photosystem I reaction center subunit IX [Nostoc sp. C3-bin3]